MKRLLHSFVSIAVVALAVTLPSIGSGATVYTAQLTGANEVPPTGSSALGSIVVTLDGNLLSVDETFSGLTTPGSAAHIHCCGAIGVNEPVAVPFTGFPNVLSGSYTNTFDLSLASSYTAAFITAQGGTAASAETAFIDALNSGQTYANIHNPTHPGGEIRGQLQATPEPASAVMLLLGLIPAATFIARRKRQ